MPQDKNPPSDTVTSRENKLAEALRVNLRRRKAAERAAPAKPQKPKPRDG